MLSTATTYGSAVGGENRTRLDIRSGEDEGGIKIDDNQAKVDDAAGKGGPVFGAGDAPSDGKPDLAATGTGA